MPKGSPRRVSPRHSLPPVDAPLSRPHRCQRAESRAALRRPIPFQNMRGERQKSIDLLVRKRPLSRVMMRRFGKQISASTRCPLVALSRCSQRVIRAGTEPGRRYSRAHGASARVVSSYSSSTEIFRPMRFCCNEYSMMVCSAGRQASKPNGRKSMAPGAGPPAAFLPCASRR